MAAVAATAAAELLLSARLLLLLAFGIAATAVTVLPILSCCVDVDDVGHC